LMPEAEDFRFCSATVDEWRGTFFSDLFEAPG
jgi:hypothetical protein